MKTQELRQIIREEISKVLKEKSNDYYPGKGDKVEATFIGTNPKYSKFKNKPFIDVVTAVISPSTEPWTAINFKNHGQIKDYNDWNFVKI